MLSFRENICERYEYPPFVLKIPCKAAYSFDQAASNVSMHSRRVSSASFEQFRDVRNLGMPEAVNSRAPAGNSR